MTQETKIIAHKASRFDSLETDMLIQTNEMAASRVAARWLKKEMGVSFVIFTTKSGEQRCSCVYDEQPVIEERIEAVIQQRFLQHIPEGMLCLHPTGDVSVPYVYDKTKVGCVFLGRGETEFSEAQIEGLFPVVRIINKAMLFFETIKINRDKNVLKEAFSRMVSPVVADKILQTTQEGNAEKGEKKVLTAMYSRLEDLVTISATIEPQALVKILNLYLSEMSAIIADLGGVMCKFEGDTIFAIFGMSGDSDHAIRACLAALRMKQIESMLNDQLTGDGLLTRALHTVIGINSGDMLMMNMGSKERPDYTALGTNASIATRVESINRFYGTSILITGSTYELCCASFETKSIGRAQLKELGRDVELYELLQEVHTQVEKYGTNLLNQTDEDSLVEF